MSKGVSYSNLDALVGNRKTVEFYHVNDKSKKDLGNVIKLAKAFDKTVKIKIGKNTLKVTGQSKLSDVFAEAKRLEQKRLAYKPSKKTVEKALKAIQGLDEGPYAGSLSG